MTRSLAFNSFAKGEISPYMRGRIDTKMYYASAEKLTNMVVRPSGVPVRRAGTKYAGTIVSPINYSRRIIPFSSSVEKSYVLEFAQTAIKIRDVDGQLVTMDLSTEFPDWVDDTSYESGDLARIDLTDDRYFLCILDHKSDPDKMPTSVTVDENWETYWYEYTEAEGQEAVDDAIWGIKLVTPYSRTEIHEVDYAQKNDVIKITHNLHEVAELRRYGDNKWAYFQDTIQGAPWAEWNDDIKSYVNIVDRNAYDTVPPTTTTAQSVGDYDAMFTEDRVGQYMRMDDFNNADENAGEQGYFKIISVDADGYGAVVEVIVEVQNSKKTTKWSWNAFYEDNYPANVTYHEGRLVLANTPEDPDKIWFSRSYIYNDFNTEDTDEGGFDLTANTAQANAIKWLSSGNALASGTFGGEFITKSPSDGALINDNKNVRQQSSWGSEAVRPEKVGSRLYYVQRGGRRLREYIYSLESNTYNSKDMTEFAEHITDPSIIDMGFQLNPDGLLFCILDNGKMAVLYRDVASEALAWTTWETQDGAVNSIAVIPNPDGLSDRVFLLISRQVAANTAQFIEFFDSHVIEESTAREDLYFVDAGVTQDSTYLGNQFDPYIEETLGNTCTVTKTPNPHYIPETVDNAVYFGRTTFDTSPRYGWLKCNLPYFEPEDITNQTKIYQIDPETGGLFGVTLEVIDDPVGTSEPIPPSSEYIVYTTWLDVSYWSYQTTPGGEWGRFSTTEFPYPPILEPATDVGEYTLTTSKAYFQASDIGRNIIFIDDNGDTEFTVEIIYFHAAGVNGEFASVGADQVGVDVVVEDTYAGGIWGPSGSTIVEPPDPEEEGQWQPYNNLGHLEGQTVDVMKDGVYVGQTTVSNGGIDPTLIEGYTTTAIGLPILSTVQTNPLNAMTPVGMAKGKIRRINTLSIDMYRSIGMEYSVSGEDDTWSPIGVPEGIDPLLLFTGTVPNLTYEGRFDQYGYIYIRQSIPYPMNLLGIYPELQIN